MPKVYHYDQTGAFMGSSDAVASPLEPGVYFTPANATTIAPPTSIPNGQNAYFVGGKWALQTALAPASPAGQSATDIAMASILAIELKQARPLRELVIAQAANPVDTAGVATAMGKIAQYNSQIIALRATLPNGTS